MVIVVAEGAGSGVRDANKLTKGVIKDQSGNTILPVNFILVRISEYFWKLKLSVIAKKKVWAPL